jgi:hypothetical protein
MADDYIRQQYEHAPGKPPKARHVSEVFGAKLAERFGPHAGSVLSHPRYRLHVFTSRGRHPLLRRQSRWRTPLGYLGAFATNAISRPAMGRWLERVVFSDSRDPFPLPLPTITSTWTMPRWPRPTPRRPAAWCCIRTSRTAWCPAGWTRA